MKRQIVGQNKKGFTVVEIMIAILVLLPVLIAIVLTLVRSMELAELNRNSAIALWDVKSKLAEIENTPFSQIAANFDNVTFISPDLTGVGVTYVNNINSSMLEVTATFSWTQKGGRIVGEDRNLNGQINGGEDINSNGILDSPVTLTTYIYDR
jgi:Tfp pilus assembly protein PilV